MIAGRAGHPVDDVNSVAGQSLMMDGSTRGHQDATTVKPVYDAHLSFFEPKDLLCGSRTYG